MRHVSPATAAQAYVQTADRVQSLLKQLENGLQTHAEKAGQRPRDWGFVGDLGSIEARLQEMIQNFHP
jgi:hypothetical protein